MELKLLNNFNSSVSTFLLIVPYGIEIRLAHLQKGYLFLLIVPYGIEMSGQPLSAWASPRY